MIEMVEVLKVGKFVGKVVFVKVEKVIMDGMMFKYVYYMVYWGLSVIDVKKEMVMVWVK